MEGAPYEPKMPLRRFPSVLALVLILAVLSALWPRAAITPLSSYDQRFYLGMAYDLRHSGRFTDGFSYAGGGPDTIRPPGMRFTPLYPVFLAAMASVDPELRRGIDCVERTAGRDPACPRGAPRARWAQFLMLAAFYWLLWATAGRVIGSMRAGWTALALALMTAPFLLLSVNTLMTETMSLLLSTAACAAAAEAVSLSSGHPSSTGRKSSGALATYQSRAVWWLACGLMLGLAILSRPAFLYLLWAGLGLTVVRAIRTQELRSATDVAMLAAGAGIVVLPWILRNALVLHRAALSFGYASHTLIQRIAFDAMTRREYGLSFVCWLPDGAGLGKMIAGPHACDRFGWDEHPDSFYSIGTGPLMQQSVAAAGGWDHHMSYILHHYLFAEPLKHMAVTIPMALRGLYIDHYWGLLLAPLSVIAIISGARRRQVGILVLSLPAWFMLLFNALVAVNQPRYNLLLILPFSLAGALMIERLLASGQPATRAPGQRQKETFS